MKERKKERMNIKNFGDQEINKRLQQRKKK